jgi:D-psicose/D-tagatose/L-ribulose 3-epimerase
MTTPPIGANLWIWDSPVTTDVIRTRAPQVAAMGFDAIELPLESPVDWSARDVAAILETTGLRPGVCAAMGPGRDLTTTDPTIVAGTQAYLRSCIEHAAGIGARIVAGPIYSPTGHTFAISPEDRARKIDSLANNLAPVLGIADAHGVRLAVEPLNRFETSLFNTVAQVMELIETVAHPALGVLLDTFHMNIEERSIGDAIRAAGARMRHLHTCENDRGAPGSGHVPWDEVAKACRDIGYKGPMVIESFTAKVKSIARAAAIWRSFAASQDALATEGLSYLRKLFPN